MGGVICMLRAVNVGGRNLIKMEDLKRICSSLGWTGPRTLLQSGNVVFDAGKDTDATVARKLADAIEKGAGFRPEVLARSAAELKTAMDQNPFAGPTREDPSHVLIMFLVKKPAKGLETKLKGAIKGREEISLHGSELYLYYPDGIGRSKLTTAVIEKALETPGTARNWNTVGKLLAMCDSK